MAVDTSLIQGAYRANQPQKLAGVEAISDITKSLAGGLQAYMDNQIAKHTVRNAEYDAFAQSVLDNSDLVGEQYEALYDEIQAGKTDFANADVKTRNLMRRNLSAMASDYADYKALREDVAINLDDYSPMFTNSFKGKEYLKILKGEGKKLINKNGRIGIEVYGEWRSISNIRQDLNANKIDKTSIDALESFRILNQDSQKPFDQRKTRASIMNGLVSKGSYNSLRNDEIIPGRIFINDLRETLKDETYEGLGITEKDLERVDGVNPSDGLDVKEIENIISYLDADKSLMKEVMADYYTNYIRKNIGVKPMDAKSKDEINSQKGYTTQRVTDIQTRLKDEGYDIEVDGIWGPKTEEAWRNYTTSPGINFNTAEFDNMKGGSINKDGEFVRDETTERKSAIGETDPFKSMLKKKQYKVDREGLDEDILAYFKDMEGRLSSEIYNSANFVQWLKNNNKKRLELK